MRYEEIPSDEVVVNVLSGLHGSVTAAALCQALIGRDFEEADSQLAIQRTIERGKIKLNGDWSLTIAEPERRAA